MHADWANFNANPMSPHIIAVGPLTAAPAKALPQDLEEFMQSAGDHGVVYASLGTTAIPGDLHYQLIVPASCCLQLPWQLPGRHSYPK